MTLDDFIKENEKLLSEAFAGDMDKAHRWLSKPNLNFGNSSPKDLIEKGISRKVKFWLEQFVGG